MIPEVVFCEEQHLQEPFIDLGVVAGVRRTPFRFVSRVTANGVFFRRVDVWGLALFMADGYVVVPSEGTSYYIFYDYKPIPVEDYPAPPVYAVDDLGNVYWTRFIGDEYVRGGEVRFSVLLPGGGLAYTPVTERGIPLSGYSIDSGADFLVAALLSARYREECLRQLRENKFDLWSLDKECNPSIRSVYHGA
ncbi:hypothetical protein, partial [Pyrobaculum sp.]|uniref:hypothetical protein n=1 Tax=Pyrobaculum sp. TaxID=2004705 RepID=UPI003D097679